MPTELFTSKATYPNNIVIPPVALRHPAYYSRSQVEVGIKAELFEFFERIWAWMSRILKLYDSESLASDSTDLTSLEVNLIDSWIVYQKFVFLALKLAQNYVLLIRLVELIKITLFPVFLLYIVSICP